MQNAKFCRLIEREAPDAPQPTKQDLASSEWNPRPYKFPDWKPVGVRYDKFRRHYLVAQAAEPFTLQIV